MITGELRSKVDRIWDRFRGSSRDRGLCERLHEHDPGVMPGD